jgi:hypothetical protein
MRAQSAIGTAIVAGVAHAVSTPFSGHRRCAAVDAASSWAWRCKTPAANLAGARNRAASHLNPKPRRLRAYPKGPDCWAGCDKCIAQHQGRNGVGPRR